MCIRDSLALSANPPPTLNAIAERAGTSGYAAESVPLAIAAAPAALIDFEATMGSLVHMGGDVDTVASMCGQIAGAALGADHLPRRWRGELEPWVEPGFARFTRALTGR